MFSSYLTFSDAAKFADIARNIYYGRGWGASFNFFNYKLLYQNPTLFPAKNTPAAMPYAIAVFFRVFGVSDVAVIATSFFFFILLIIFNYLLAKKLFGKFVGLLSSILILSNLAIWDYATSGASEPLFMFEIVVVPYLMLLKRKWSDILSVVFMFLMYITRPQAFIFIAGYMIFYLLIHFSWRKSLTIFLSIIVFGLLVDNLILPNLSGSSYVYSITERGIRAVVQFSQDAPVSDIVRGSSIETASLKRIVSRTIINLFNFYRLLPNIISPFIFIFFIISIFIRSKHTMVKAFKIASIFCVVFSFLLPALTIPFFRYIHPVFPLIYILGSYGLLYVTTKVVGNKYSNLFSIFFVLLFISLISLGTTLHDYRYYQSRKNYNKPPVYVTLAKVLEENTDKDDLILTNLDTWGTWYGERKTMWFPTLPSKIIPPKGEETPIDAIYLTSYLMDDENYYMGENWRKIFQEPENIDITDCEGCVFIRDNFYLEGEFEISPEENYENLPQKAVVFVRRKGS